MRLRRALVMSAIFGAAIRGYAADHCDSSVSAVRRQANVRLAPPLSQAGRKPSCTASKMAWIPGGEFWMGSDNAQMVDAQPVHRVFVDGFWMDKTEVTNIEFGRFISATGYVTVAERQLNPRDFPGVPAAALRAGSVVFSPPEGPVDHDASYAWWSFVRNADWRHPEGPGSNLNGRENHPVVHVAWEDAAAYAQWVRKRLPTEAEWEFAARGGLDRQPYVWGREFRPGKKFMANSFQGVFPQRNTAEDGYRATAPVASFPANNYGLFDMAGNVWEWCADWYSPDYYRALAQGKEISRNPQGPEASSDSFEPGLQKRVQKGGSFLCTDQYCSRYMPGARGRGEVSTGTNHVGFRCVRGK